MIRITRSPLRFIVHDSVRWLHSRSDCASAETLRVGVVGLGAVGTIVFARLGAAALSAQSSTLAVEALVKPKHLEALFATHSRSDGSERAVVTLQDAQGSAQPTRIAFQRRSETLAEAIESSSVRIRALTGEGHDGPDEPLSVVIVAVKAYDSAATVRALQQHHEKLLKDDALVVLLQNGIDDAPVEAADRQQQMEKEPLAWRFAHGVTYVGGRAVVVGNVVVSGAESATTYIAPMASAVAGGHDALAVNKKIDALGQALTAAGLRWERLTADAMKAMQWKKLIVNAGINPIASILNAPNQSVGACEWSRACVATVVHEAFEVASKENVALGCTEEARAQEQAEEELVRDVLHVAANTGANVCSMLADLRRGSKTEIEEITGRIVALGRTHGVPTPGNDMLLLLVKALEEQQTHVEVPR